MAGESQSQHQRVKAWLGRGRGRSRFAQSSIHARHDFCRHELHRSFGKLGLMSVVPDVKQCPERPNLLTQRNYFFGNGIRRSPDHQMLENIFQRAL